MRESEGSEGEAERESADLGQRGAAVNKRVEEGMNEPVRLKTLLSEWDGSERERKRGQLNEKEKVLHHLNSHYRNLNYCRVFSLKTIDAALMCLLCIEKQEMISLCY